MHIITQRLYSQLKLTSSLLAFSRKMACNRKFPTHHRHAVMTVFMLASGAVALTALNISS